MADRKRLSHVKSNVALDEEFFGLTRQNAKRPSSTDLINGEIAINYKKGHELLTIKNDEDGIVGFLNENEIYEAEEIIASALVVEKSEREEADATEKYERELAIETEKSEREEAEVQMRHYIIREIDSAVAYAAQYIEEITDIRLITYEELKTLRDDSQLNPGQYYRITDFVTTTTTQEYFQSAGHAFDIIVLATDVNVLNENAKAIKHDSDTYFDDANLDAWELKYDLDNDKSKYGWADEVSGKGVIFFMKDEWNNEAPYDFKNIMFWRYKIDDFDIDVGNASEYVGKFLGGVSLEGDIYPDLAVLGDKKAFYTFSNVLEDGTVTDASIYANTECSGNVLKEVVDEYGDFGGAENSRYPNDIVFENENNTVCFGNTFGEKCYSNTFGNNCYYNSFGNYCHNNSFGNYCYYNSFGNNCYYNSFGNYCHSNTFGNNCYYNSFGNNCHNNSFGNNCHYNSFGNYCHNNSFGNGVEHVNFSKDYMYCNIVENGNKHIIVTSSQTTSISTKLQNFTIAQGVNNTDSTVKTISHNTVNDAFKTTYQNANSTTVNV